MMRTQWWSVAAKKKKRKNQIKINDIHVYSIVGTNEKPHKTSGQENQFAWRNYSVIEYGL